MAKKKKGKGLVGKLFSGGKEEIKKAPGPGNPIPEEKKEKQSSSNQKKKNNSKDSKEKILTKESQESLGAKGSKQSIVSKESKDSLDSKETQGSKESQESLVSKGSQETQDVDNKEYTQKTFSIEDDLLEQYQRLCYHKRFGEWKDGINWILRGYFKRNPQPPIEDSDDSW